MCASVVLRGLTVLVIDDDLDALEAVEHVLADAGARVLAAPTSETALRLADTSVIDALVYRGSETPAVLSSLRARRNPKRPVAAIALGPTDLRAIVGRVLAATTS